MQHSQSLWQNRRGITVLALLLLIIAVVILAFFLIRYLGTGTAPAPEVRTESSREPAPSHRARWRPSTALRVN
jgi:hypothetical protein